MDRRSWLWRRKSSEKSPGETESSESLSPLSERLSDEQAFVNSQAQSPELTSKDNNHTPSEDELREVVKTLGEKLSAALENIRAKEELVKQHSKVAEEAVLGWENAETDVMNLKQKLELETNKTSVLEDRVGQLDGALKECLRQLRQAKEEQQEQKINEAFVTKACEWEFLRSELESQILELQTQLQASQESAMNSESSEITHLKIELQEQYEELEIRTIERDLNAQAAEAACKQNLDNIKKVYKLEAEIRRLKATIRKGTLGSDLKSAASSSIYVESFTDSQSDIGERLLALENEKLDDYESASNLDSWASALIQEPDQFKNEKALNSTGGINLMDDFLEMERLAALPEKQNDKESNLKTELDTLIQQNAELEGKLEKLVMEKTNLEGQLEKLVMEKTKLEGKLEKLVMEKTILEGKLEKLVMEKTKQEIAFTDCCDQLKTTLDKSIETEKKVMKLEVELLMAIEAKHIASAEIETTNSIRELAEAKLASAESQVQDLSSKLHVLEEKFKKERLIATEVEAKCQKLQDEIWRLTSETEVRNVENMKRALNIKQDKELEVAALKFTDCQRTIASLGRQLKSLATLEDFLIESSEKAPAAAAAAIHLAGKRSALTEIAL